MRGRYGDITASGAEVVAVGTGDVRYARAFVEQEDIPFPVLVDDNGDAARAASLGRLSARQLLSPRGYVETFRTWRSGHKIHKAGKRVTQLGATFVVGPGPRVTYEHLDESATDHAPVDDVLTAISG